MSNWIPGFSTPIAAALFGLLVPLIVFYFLKLKRPRLQLPSLALWRQVISDQRVNSPFQRFRRNLLLLLQILLLCLLVLAAMQPYWRGDLADAQYLPILIDTSASMGAIDQTTGKTRLDLAKREVQRIIDGLLPGQQISLISVTNTARRLTEFTNNRTVLNDAMQSLAVSDLPSKVEDSLRLAQALTKTNAVSSVRLYSDGNVPTRPDPATGKPQAIVDFDLPFKLDFQQIPAKGANIGITAFNARRASTSSWDVFVRVDGSSDASTAGKVILENHGEKVAEEDVILTAKETQRLVFKVDADKAASLKATIKPEGFDALASDNAAWLELPVGRDLTVFCPTSLDSYRHALAGIPGILVEPAEDGSMKLASYDLVITDAIAEEARQASTYLFVGVIPPDLSKDITIEQNAQAEVVDWQRDATLLQHVQLKDVQFMDNPVRSEKTTDTQLEAAGYDFLAFSKNGPLILQKREGARLKLFLLVHTDRSTLPYRVGFPVMVSNVANIALQQAEISELASSPTGTLPRLHFQPNEDYQVTSPTGEHFDQKSDADGFINGIPATTAGLYEVRKGGDLVSKVGVALLNPTETSLAGVNELKLNEISVTAESDRLKADKPWWPTLAMLAFATLLVEWWLFQKRPGGINA
ncbi:MAG TPA: BatA and WFA domain-containing protein [Caulifigura sp.]|nr:BatA and WFA domain-containing protein [Caulifigura sp.]